MKSFIVHANSTEEKVEWMVDICNAVDDWKARKATFEKDNDKKQTEEFEAPGTPDLPPTKKIQKKIKT